MKIIEVKDQAAGGKAGRQVFEAALENGAEVFGLATGSTPISIYDELTSSDVDFSDKISINLDEYVGLSGDDEQSYRYFMTKHLFSKKPFRESYVPNGKAEDIQVEATRYENVINNNPIDLQLLGLGQNGHIGFNEPGTPFDELTHEVALTESTIEANARFFDNKSDVPTDAISMGIGSIMKGKQILLVAYGEAKADAVAAMIEGPLTADMPASALQKHDDVIVIVDAAASSKLQNRDNIEMF